MHINCVFSGPKSKNSDFENEVRWVFPKIDGHSSTKEPVMVCFFIFKSSYLSFGLKFRYILMAQVLPGMQDKLSKSRDLALEPMG